MREKILKNQHSKYRSMPFWVWRGELNKEKLKEQIEAFRKMGFGEVLYACKVRPENAILRRRIHGGRSLLYRIGKSPPITQFAMYNKAAAPKNVFFYPEYGHEGMKGADDILFIFLSDL